MTTGLRTHREGLCTGTAKSVWQYNIYLDLCGLQVYQYIIAPLVFLSSQETKRLYWDRVVERNECMGDVSVTNVTGDVTFLHC